MHAKKKLARASSSDAAPEAEDNDPLAQFWRTRDRQPNARRPAWKRGHKERGESSNEGNLSEVEWCSGCGSLECELDLEECRAANKAKQLSATLPLMFNYGGLTIDDETTENSVMQQHELNQSRLSEREEEKIEVRTKIKERQQAFGWSTFEETTRKH